MSDTIFGEPVHKPPAPRTDERAGEGRTFSPSAELVFADFARELERENELLRRAITDAVEDLRRHLKPGEYHGVADRLERRLEYAREPK